MELSKEEIELLIDSLSFMQEKSVTMTNSFNNPVYDECGLLIERLKSLMN